MTSTVYPVHKKTKKLPHGNTKTGLPFYEMTQKGDAFVVPPEDYSRTNCARAHFQKKMAMRGTPVKFSSRAVKDERGKVTSYVFRRETPEFTDESADGKSAG